jgi:predicted PurR-regulated permease PerM
MLISILDHFTISELFCICICLVCVVAVVLGFFLLQQVDSTLHDYEKELRNESRENAANIGKLQRRVYYIESKLPKL